MARLIIEYPDDMTTYNALEFVQAVVKQGKISVAAGVNHFCWIAEVCIPPTTCMVATRRKKVGQKADSLVVYRR